MKQAYNRYIAYKYCYDDDIICFLDGDDWLFDNNVLSNLNQEYKSKNVLMTYGSYFSLKDNKYKFIKANKYSKEVILNKTFREQKGWYGIPLRTGYARLYKNMPESYLKDTNGNWLSACTDIAEFLWAIEQVPNNVKVINYPTYVYNINASIRFQNSIYNLSKSQYKYRKQVSDRLFDYNLN